LITPTVTLSGEELFPNLVWEDAKVMLFDEIEEDTTQSLRDMGWYVDTMEASPEKLSKRLKGVD
jgi:hypothetical protein